MVCPIKYGAFFVNFPLIQSIETKQQVFFSSKHRKSHGSVSKPMETPVVHIKIAGIDGCE